MADYRFEGEHMYHGMVMEASVDDETLGLIPHLQIVNGDVLVASYPKTGTTWTENLLWLVTNNAEDLTIPLHARIPYLEMKMDGITSGLDLLKNLPRPAITKTHLPAWAFKKQIEEGHLKVVVVIRNPKDTLVSFYNFYRMHNKLGNFKGSFNNFFELYKAKHLLYGDYFDWYKSWMPYLKHPNVTLVSYEDMKFQMTDVIQHLTKFLGMEPLTNEKQRIIEHKTSFDQMKSNKFTSYEDAPIFNTNISPFMRKGVVGDWKNYFTDKQSALIDKLYKEHLESKGIKLRFE